MEKINHGEVAAAAAASNKSATMKKDICCKYCNKKFSSYQALGGHYNGHKAERAAEKQKKIRSNASSYCRKSFVGGFANSNHAYNGFGGKTLGVSPLSMARFKPHHGWPHMGVTHVAWPWHQILNPPPPQPTMHQFMAEGSGFHQNDHKSYQPLISSEGPNSGSQSQPHSLHPSLFQEFGQASNSSIIERPDENSGQENSSSSISMAANGAVKELDLTLKL